MRVCYVKCLAQVTIAIPKLGTPPIDNVYEVFVAAESPLGAMLHSLDLIRVATPSRVLLANHESWAGEQLGPDPPALVANMRGGMWPHQTVEALAAVNEAEIEELIRKNEDDPVRADIDRWESEGAIGIGLKSR